MMARAARIMEVIQKRMVIFDSWNGRWGQLFRIYWLVASSWESSLRKLS